MSSVDRSSANEPEESVSATFDHPSLGLGAWSADLMPPQALNDGLDLESTRLEAEIQSAKARAAAARHRAADRSAELRSRLRTEVAISQHRLDELDRAHEDDVRTVREAGRVEAERIIADARLEVARIRGGLPQEGNDVG